MHEKSLPALSMLGAGRQAVKSTCGHDGGLDVERQASILKTEVRPHMRLSGLQPGAAPFCVGAS